VINKITKSNTSQTKVADMKKSKIWLGDDGIVRVKVGKTMDEGIIDDLANDFQGIARKLSSKAKVLIDLGSVPNVPISSFRRKATRLIKDAFKNPGFEKIALYKGGVIPRTVVSFILVAAGLKNIKYFKTEEEALKWLRE